MLWVVRRDGEANLDPSLEPAIGCQQHEGRWLERVVSRHDDPAVINASLHRLTALAWVLIAQQLPSSIAEASRTAKITSKASAHLEIRIGRSTNCEVPLEDVVLQAQVSASPAQETCFRQDYKANFLECSPLMPLPSSLGHSLFVSLLFPAREVFAESS